MKLDDLDFCVYIVPDKAVDKLLELCHSPNMSIQRMGIGGTGSLKDFLHIEYIDYSDISKKGGEYKVITLDARG